MCVWYERTDEDTLCSRWQQWWGLWEQGASGGSIDDGSDSACARMKRRRLGDQGYRGLYSHCQDSMTTRELTSHIKHFTFKLFKVGHLNLKCVLVLFSVLGGLSLTLWLSHLHRKHIFILLILFFFPRLSAATSCSLAAVKMLHYTLVLTWDRVMAKRGTLLLNSYAFELKTYPKTLNRIFKSVTWSD